MIKTWILSGAAFAGAFGGGLALHEACDVDALVPTPRPAVLPADGPALGGGPGLACGTTAPLHAAGRVADAADAVEDGELWRLGCFLEARCAPARVTALGPAAPADGP